MLALLTATSSRPFCRDLDGVPDGILVVHVGDGVAGGAASVGDQLDRLLEGRLGVAGHRNDGAFGR